MCLKLTTFTLIVIGAHLYNNTRFLLQLIDRISTYKAQKRFSHQVAPRSLVYISRWMFSGEWIWMSCLVHITAVVMMIRCDATTWLLATHKFSDARNDIEVGINYLSFQRPRQSWRQTSYFGHYQKAEGELGCISNLVLSTPFVFKKHIFLIWFWTNISIEITH